VHQEEAHHPEGQGLGDSPFFQTALGERSHAGNYCIGSFWIENYEVAGVTYEKAFKEGGR
jgi:hypothetical protein